jgi:hypothetical protein
MPTTQDFVPIIIVVLPKPGRAEKNYHDWGLNKEITIPNKELVHDSSRRL